jgi:hypothetical protein
MSEYMLNRARRARDEVATITIAPVRWRAAAGAMRRGARAPPRARAHAPNKAAIQ